MAKEQSMFIHSKGNRAALGELEEFLYSWAHRHKVVTKDDPLGIDIVNQNFSAHGLISLCNRPFDLTLDDWDQVSKYSRGGRTDRLLTFMLCRKNKPFTSREIGGMREIRHLNGEFVDFRAPFTVAVFGKNGRGRFTYALKRIPYPA